MLPTNNTLNTNDASITKDTDEGAMMVANSLLMTKDIKKSVGHLNRLIESSLSSSNNLVQMEQLHDKIKSFISVMDPESGTRVQRN